MTARNRPETAPRVGVVELTSAETPPLTALQPRAGHSWWTFLLPQTRPDSAERWRIVRSMLGDALTGAGGQLGEWIPNPSRLVQFIGKGSS